MHWMILPYRRYFEFSGRSRRLEYWWFAVFTTVVILVLAIAGVASIFDILRRVGAGENPEGALAQIGAGSWVAFAVIGLFIVVSLIPGIAVQVRRLHDLGVSGWWYLLFVVSGGILPEIGEIGNGVNSLASLGWVVWMFFPGTNGPNKYGDDPKDPTAAGVFA